MVKWNPEHLKKIKQGVEAWNEWRKSNEAISPHLACAKLNGTDLAGANLRRSNFVNAQLRAANLRRAELTDGDFTGAKMDGAHLRNSLSFHACFREAQLQNVDWGDSHLVGVDLSRASLLNANLRITTLVGTVFRSTELAGADFTNATIEDSIFGNVDLSNVRGLDSVHHAGPSLIGIDTLVRSGGNIPERFLRGAGTPDPIVAYVSSLAGSPIRFSTCFISHTSDDGSLAAQLFSGLQAAGVRCWLTPENQTTGNQFYQLTRKPVRGDQKVLVILSERSIISDWVAREVESTLYEERRSGETILFPIGADDVAMTSDAPCAANIRRTRQIEDFAAWRDPARYDQAFARLLRDLGKPPSHGVHVRPHR